MADYTRLVARGLAEAGDRVEVLAPPSRGPRLGEPLVRVQDLAGTFNTRAIVQLNRWFNRRSPDRRVLLQYSPHAFGWNGMNLPFCMWLYSMRRGQVFVMFHEVWYRFARAQSVRRNGLAAATHLMAMLVARRADRIFVSIPGWADFLKRWTGGKTVRWLPVPSNLPVVSCADRAAMEIRPKYCPESGFLLGHFGTYGPLIADRLEECLHALLEKRPECNVLLLGRNSRAFQTRFAGSAAHLAGRVHALGGLEGPELARCAGACDLMIQPYPDGVSSRRGSVMFALSNGIPVVTNSGYLTEPLWKERGAVAMAPNFDRDSIVDVALQLMSNRCQLRSLRDRSRRLYSDLFDIKWTLAELRKE